VQIILNALRLKPPEQVLPAAEAAGVGIIARVPLASGLLSGKYDENTTFPDDDHRNCNRDGSAFDLGETSPVCRTTWASRQRAASPGW
jgi:aryl-alcohol dehydrogenase-like predicted oxidoreductase